MPIYRYRCESCNTVFKILVKNGSDPEIECPKCNGYQVERLLPRVGVIYRGKGYHKTDYRDKAEGSLNTDDGSEE